MECTGKMREGGGAAHALRCTLLYTVQFHHYYTLTYTQSNEIIIRKIDQEKMGRVVVLYSLTISPSWSCSWVWVWTNNIWTCLISKTLMANTTHQAPFTPRDSRGVGAVAVSSFSVLAPHSHSSFNHSLLHPPNFPIHPFPSSLNPLFPFLSIA